MAKSTKEGPITGLLALVLLPIFWVVLDTVGVLIFGVRQCWRKVRYLWRRWRCGR